MDSGIVKLARQISSIATGVEVPERMWRKNLKTGNVVESAAGDRVGIHTAVAVQVLKEGTSHRLRVLIGAHAVTNTCMAHTLPGADAISHAART